MSRHRGIGIPFITRLTSPMKVLVASLFVIIGVMVLVLWGLNRGPDFPAISYVPNADIMKDVFPSANDNEKSPLISRLNIDTDSYKNNGFSGSVSMAEMPAELSDEKKLEIIREKYEVLFYNLKAAYEKELERMIKYAKGDYFAAKNGQRDISYAKIAMEYMKVGRALESDSDQRFAGLLAEMKNELNANNLPLDVAKQAEKEYNAQKDLAKKEILVKIARLGR